METRISHYQILGIQDDVNDDKISHAQREQSLIWHPDRIAQWTPSETGLIDFCNQVFDRIQTAHKVLSVEEERKKYQPKPLFGAQKQEEQAFYNKWKRLQAEYAKFLKRQSDPQALAQHLATQLQNIQTSDDAQCADVIRQLQNFPKPPNQDTVNKLVDANQKLQDELAAAKQIIEKMTAENNQLKWTLQTQNTDDSSLPTAKRQRHSPTQPAQVFFNNVAQTSAKPPVTTTGRFLLAGLLIKIVYGIGPIGFPNIKTLSCIGFIFSNDYCYSLFKNAWASFRSTHNVNADLIKLTDDQNNEYFPLHTSSSKRILLLDNDYYKNLFRAAGILNRTDLHVPMALAELEKYLDVSNIEKQYYDMNSKSLITNLPHAIITNLAEITNRRTTKSGDANTVRNGHKI